jgi:uncharacterized protein YutE (UPF0331/DUF86 family)
MKRAYIRAVTERLAAMQGYLDELGDVARVTPEQYLENRPLRRGGERLLQLVVESATDAARMFMLGRGLNPGPSHAACFQNLAHRNLLARDLSARLIQYVSVRNVVVHDYLTLDDEAVFRQIQEAPAVFGEFLKEMQRLLEGNK